MVIIVSPHWWLSPGYPIHCCELTPLSNHWSVGFKRSLLSGIWSQGAALSVDGAWDFFRSGVRRIFHGSLVMSPLNITQPLGIWSIILMATIRWCPIYPKWDIYQPLYFHYGVLNHAFFSCLNHQSIRLLFKTMGISLINDVEHLLGGGIQTGLWGWTETCLMRWDREFYGSWKRLTGEFPLNAHWGVGINANIFRSFLRSVIFHTWSIWV